MRQVSIGGIVYLIIGVIVAVNRAYFVDLTTLSHLLSAFVAVVLWPLLLFGANLHIVL
ncbi:MAG: hypothetical protein ABI220_04315 [Candidatus Saccharimonadales bacterium]